MSDRKPDIDGKLVMRQGEREPPSRERRIALRVGLGFIAAFCAFMFTTCILTSHWYRNRDLPFSDLHVVYLGSDLYEVWRGPSGENGCLVSPAATMRWHELGLQVAAEKESHRASDYVLSARDGLWIFETEKLGLNETTIYTSVNPKLEGSGSLIYELASLIENEPVDWAAIDQHVAENYVFLGYAVRNEEELGVLKEALASRAGWDLLAPYVEHGGTKLFRLDPATVDGEMEGYSPPFLIERPNVSRGHPLDTITVLYLDGHVETIPWGTKFPATDALIEFLDE